jgi:hypothetical protein
MTRISGQTTDGLYQKVTSITEDYLGPATNRFIARLVANHLHKRPEDLVADDLPTLIQWAKVTLGLLTEDNHLVDEYVLRMNGLITSPGAGQ